MPKTAAPPSIPLAQARAAFFAAQGIPPAGKPALLSALERTGFVRTLGGIDVYLALRARVPGLSRADLDGAVSFLPFEDNLLALRGGPAILVDPAYHGLRVPVWGGTEDKLGSVRYRSSARSSPRGGSSASGSPTPSRDGWSSPASTR